MRESLDSQRLQLGNIEIEAAEGHLRELEQIRDNYVDAMGRLYTPQGSVDDAFRTMGAGVARGAKVEGLLSGILGLGDDDTSSTLWQFRR